MTKLHKIKTSIKSVKLDDFGRISIEKEGHEYSIIINEKEVEAIISLRKLLEAFS